MKYIATKGSDKIEIEITDEGVIKMSTDKVSQAQHGSVESIYAQVASLAGGIVKRVLKPGISLEQVMKLHASDGHTHTHDGHTHTH